ncbi:MAG: hypothetical protein MJ137_07895, partial [Clostridia bacterium]|nr:hypothetical protein [Clostridia bacterium]
EYGNSNGIIPDMIIHERNKDINNLLIIEVKTWWNKDQTRDNEKINRAIDEYGYHAGMTVLLDKNQAIIKIRYKSDKREDIFRIPERVY